MATFTIGNFSGLSFKDNALVTQSLQVYGIQGTLTKIVLSLGGISHTYTDDLDMVLSSPDQGGYTDNLMFWSDVGSSQDLKDTTIILRDDAFGALLDDYAPGDAAYRPATYAPGEIASDFGITGANNFFSAGDGTNNPFASAFAGDNPNGAWTLRVRDDASGDIGSLEGWSLIIETGSFIADIQGTSGADTIRIDLNSYDGSGSYRMNNLPVIGFSGVTRIDIHGGAGADTILGSAAQETIYGGPDRDTIRAGGGKDLVLVAAGDDVAGEIYDGGAGIDQLFFSGFGTRTLNLRDDTLASFESLFFGYGDRDFIETIQMRATQFGTGLVANSTIIGTDNSDDTVANASDRLFIEMGTATSLDLRSYIFKAFSEPGDYVRIAGGGAAETIHGSTVIDIITGGSGNDLLDGGLGADTLYGEAGSDQFYVDNPGDRTIETAADIGTDRVLTSTSYTLNSGQSIELFTTTQTAGTATISLTGNDLVQTIIGNNGANTIDGKGGSDTLYGKGGSDNFLFTSTFSSSNVDNIADFSHADDTIQLSKSVFTAFSTTGTIASGAFKANSTGTATDSDDRIIYETDTGKLFYDSNGNAAGGSHLIAILTTKPADLAYNDFVIVA